MYKYQKAVQMRIAFFMSIFLKHRVFPNHSLIKKTENPRSNSKIFPPLFFDLFLLHKQKQQLCQCQKKRKPY